MGTICGISNIYFFHRHHSIIGFFSHKQETLREQLRKYTLRSYYRYTVNATNSSKKYTSVGSSDSLIIECSPAPINFAQTMHYVLCLPCLFCPLALVTQQLQWLILLRVLFTLTLMLCKCFKLSIAKKPTMQPRRATIA